MKRSLFVVFLLSIFFFHPPKVFILAADCGDSVNCDYCTTRRIIETEEIFVCSGTCIPCPTGSVCNGETRYPCDAGYYNDVSEKCGTSGTDCTKCENGYFCPVETTNPVKCNCSDHGNCTASVDDCQCDYGYGGDHCEEFACWGLTTSGGACGGHGYCQQIDDCGCFPGYQTEDDCSVWFCGSYRMDNTSDQICNGRGQCDDPDECTCETNFSGDLCEIDITPQTVIDYEELIKWSIIAAVIVACIVGVILVIGCIGLIIGIIWLNVVRKTDKKLKKFGNTISLLELEEKELANKNVARFNINKKLMEIDAGEMKLIRKLGAGAFAEVFLCSWDGREVAMKLFQTKTLSETSEFVDFEKELEILSSISHPNILQFFGCSLRPPRVGIVVEFCSKGDLKNYLNENMISFKRKRKILKGIVGAVMYIHKREIIHRDLKTENILLTENETAKLCDFGLSKIIEKSNSKRMTKRTGTAMYMAPEVVLGEVYDSKVDVFSFAIIMYEVLTQCINIYPNTKNVPNIELKVANDPTFRPKINEKKYSYVKWYVDMMKRGWSNDPLKRPTMEEINHAFSKSPEARKNVVHM